MDKFKRINYNFLCATGFIIGGAVFCFMLIRFFPFFGGAVVVGYAGGLFCRLSPAGRTGQAVFLLLLLGSSFFVLLFLL